MEGTGTIIWIHLFSNKTLVKIYLFKEVLTEKKKHQFSLLQKKKNHPGKTPPSFIHLSISITIIFIDIFNLITHLIKKAFLKALLLLIP